MQGASVSRSASRTSAQEEVLFVKTVTGRLSRVLVDHINDQGMFHIAESNALAMKNVDLAAGLIILVLEKVGQLIATRRRMNLDEGVDRACVIECMRATDLPREFLVQQRAPEALVRAFVGLTSTQSADATVVPMDDVERQAFVDLLIGAWATFNANAPHTGPRVSNLCFSKQSFNVTLDAFYQEPQLLRGSRAS